MIKIKNEKNEKHIKNIKYLKLYILLSEFILLNIRNPD